MRGKIALISVLIMLLGVILTGNVNASLQSRPGATSLVNKSASVFFLLSRQMETSSGPMGLNATIEIQNDKVVETSASNNIDVHMIKNTEYGTAAMLAASSYGKCPTGSSSASTTGNSSGIMQMAGGKLEHVAGIYNTGKAGADYKYIYNADSWHKNLYATDVAKDSYIPGDATYETHNWYGSSNSNFVSASYPIFRRGTPVFGYARSTVLVADLTPRFSCGCCMWSRTLINSTSSAN